MIFNSLSFLVFFVLFFIFYWFVFNRNLKIQNLLLLIASYVFYSWWDWHFLTLLAGSSLIIFIIAIKIERSINKRFKDRMLYLGLSLAIAVLIFFKYFNFFLTSLSDALSTVHLNINVQTLNIILPLGISFYTFRLVSYLLDVHKGKFKATTDAVVFLAYIAFFPSLISGPIDKAKLLIPQLEKKRVFDFNQAADGLSQILWGLFKKVVIADNCATLSNGIFENYQNMPASSLLLSSFFFTIQIYADFSGYSDMAIGISRLIGFSITKNFDFPFFAQNIAEYWRKWHISLTSWLTEYIFTPLSIHFRDYGNTGLVFSILINFTIIGIWHGANWTFVLFGFLHGCYYIPLILRGALNKRKKIAKGKLIPSFKEATNMLATFILVMLTLILFRANSITEAYNYFTQLFSLSLFATPEIHTGSLTTKIVFFSVVSMFIIEWLGRDGQYGIQNIAGWPKLIRWAAFYLLLALVFIFAGSNQQFIYFQF